MNDIIEQECGSGGTSAEDKGGMSTADMKERVEQSARQAGATVKDTTATVASKVKQTGQEAAAQLKEQSRDFAYSRKEELASRIKGGGEAVRRAAEKLREEDDPNIAHYANALADRIVGVGDYVKSRDMNAMRRDLEQVARRRPEIVFGGMFLAGLALARFLKASSPENDSYSDKAIDRRTGVGDWQESSGTPQVSMAEVPGTVNSPVMADENTLT